MITVTVNGSDTRTAAIVFTYFDVTRLAGLDRDPNRYDLTVECWHNGARRYMHPGSGAIELKPGMRFEVSRLVEGKQVAA